MADKSNPRADRLRSALRENLKRRKEQARERAQNEPEASGQAARRPNSARIPDDSEREN
jgi:hypothetical protein